MRKKTRATIVLLPKYKEANNIYEHLYYTELFEGEEFLKKSLTQDFKKLSRSYSTVSNQLYIPKSDRSFFQMPFSQEPKQVYPQH